MNVGYLVGLWLDKELKKRGANGLLRHLTTMVGAYWAGKVVTVLVKGGTAKAVALIGAKAGIFAGPLGAAIGTGAGVL